MPAGLGEGSKDYKEEKNDDGTTRVVLKRRFWPAPQCGYKSGTICWQNTGRAASARRPPRRWNPLGARAAPHIQLVPDRPRAEAPGGAGPSHFWARRPCYRVPQLRPTGLASPNPACQLWRTQCRTARARRSRLNTTVSGSSSGATAIGCACSRAMPRTGPTRSGPTHKHHAAANVRFTPKATNLLRSSEMT